MHDRKLFVWNGTNYSFVWNGTNYSFVWNGTNYSNYLKRRSPNIKILLPGKIFNHHLCNKYPTVSGVFLRLPDR